MEMTEITTLISNVGFPIMCCIALFKYMKQQSQDYAQQISILKESLDNNTNILTRLYERMMENE